MKFMVLLTPAAGKTAADFAPHALAEEQALWPLYVQGHVREMYFQPEPLAVSLVFEAATVAEVEGWLQALPMVRACLFDVKPVLLGPWLPLQILFDPSHRPAPS
jgi:hypothetical protein